MKRLFVSLCLVALAAACNSTQNADATTSADSASVNTVPTEPPATVSISATLAPLGLTPDHDWRNVSLGDDFTAAKTTEKAAPFEQDANHIGYTQEFPNLESVDYQFFQQDNKVASIQVDFYLNNVSSLNSYRQELTTYLTARYGTASTKAGTSTWKNGSVILNDVSKGKDFGLLLTIK